MKAIELLLKYIQEPQLIELGEDGLAGAGCELTTEEAMVLEAVLKVVAADGPLTKLYCQEMHDVFPPELRRLGFELDDGDVVHPEGMTSTIKLGEYERWELTYRRGWLSWSYYNSGVGYPVADAVYY